jgi:REP element-mobilizing transposase RayT
MANTYTQIHIQVVFAVKNRQSLIHPEWDDRLYGYLSGIIQKHNHKTLQINGMPDHVHLLFGMRPTQSLSNLMKIVKGDSSEWINANRLSRQRFSWQEGYGAFSYAKSQVPSVIQYIRNQKQHHKKKTFREEYVDLLDSFGIEYNERFIFDNIG